MHTVLAHKSDINPFQPYSLTCHRALNLSQHRKHQLHITDRRSGDPLIQHCRRIAVQGRRDAHQLQWEMLQPELAKHVRNSLHATASSGTGNGYKRLRQRLTGRIANRTGEDTTFAKLQRNLGNEVPGLYPQ